ncbi:MAG: UV DNA damage repair endonuclease UvsE [Candidatus Colwellbacteria bacterium]|nr:UV DNA damage repair endonuclease UvsE [Candidatus Colwellbacteria bacterium]
MSNLVPIIFERDWDDLRGKMSLGLCCINETLRNHKPPVFCGRTCIRKNFTVELAQERGLQNVKDIKTMIEWNRDNGIRCLRIGSDLMPHFTDKEVEKYDMDFAMKDLKLAGDLANSLNHRIVMHPGQYNNVGAKDDNVLQSTIDDLSYHADILDGMGIDSNGVLIVHGGGTYGDKDATTRRWIEQFDDLPRKVKNRLVLENCERQYNTRDCLEIASECKIPMIFDFHHYECWNLIHKDDEQEPISELAPEIIESWGSRQILMHVSEQGDGKTGHHSDYVEKIPDELFNMIEDHDIHVDLEVEAKKKEKAVNKLYKAYPELFSNVKVLSNPSKMNNSSNK